MAAMSYPSQKIRLFPIERKKKNIYIGTMKYGITRNEAFNLVKKYLKNKNLIKHCLATEAVMKALARRFGEDQEKWALAGLLHDLDVELTNADLNVHGRETVRILKENGVDPEIIDAVRMHNETEAGKRRSTLFQHALASGETITGLIVATTLVYPDKKLASVKSKSIVRRMKEKAFAASVNRDTIRECEKIGIPLNEFAEICLNAMRDIHEELGL
jgi:putative nucleotidyltransferase with HDIG domain